MGKLLNQGTSNYFCYFCRSARGLGESYHLSQHVDWRMPSDLGAVDRHFFKESCQGHQLALLAPVASLRPDSTVESFAKPNGTVLHSIQWLLQDFRNLVLVLRVMKLYLSVLPEKSKNGDKNNFKSKKHIYKSKIPSTNINKPSNRYLKTRQKKTTNQTPTQ